MDSYIICIYQRDTNNHMFAEIVEHVGGKSDFLRIMTEVVFDSDFYIVCPKLSNSSENSLVTVLLCILV